MSTYPVTLRHAAVQVGINTRSTEIDRKMMGTGKDWALGHGIGWRCMEIENPYDTVFC